MKRVCLVFVLFSLLFSLAICCFAAPQDIIIGNWQGDIDLYLALSDVQEQLELISPEDQESMVSYVSAVHSMMDLEITGDTFLIDFGELKKDVSSYTVTDTTDNKVYITLVGEITEEIILEIVDEDHLVMYGVSESGLATINCGLKRVK